MHSRRRAYQEQLKSAHKALLAGLVLLVVNIIVYLGWISQVASK